MRFVIVIEDGPGEDDPMEAEIYTSHAIGGLTAEGDTLPNVLLTLADEIVHHEVRRASIPD